MSKVKMPSASEAEDALLGAILEDSSIFNYVLSYINDDILYKNTSKMLWNKIGNMITAGYHVDLITVTESLTEGEKSAGLTPYYMTGLFQYSVGKSLAIVYAKSIYEKYLLRLIIEQSETIQSLARNNSVGVYDTLTNTHS